MNNWEHYSQDDEVVTISHVGREKYKLFCTCGWKEKGKSETHSNNLAMNHILEHDIIYEEEYEEES